MSGGEALEERDPFEGRTLIRVEVFHRRQKFAAQVSVSEDAVPGDDLGLWVRVAMGGLAGEIASRVSGGEQP